MKPCWMTPSCFAIASTPQLPACSGCWESRPTSSKPREHFDLDDTEHGLEPAPEPRPCLINSAIQNPPVTRIGVLDLNRSILRRSGSGWLWRSNNSDRLSRVWRVDGAKRSNRSEFCTARQGSRAYRFSRSHTSVTPNECFLSHCCSIRFSGGCVLNRERRAYARFCIWTKYSGISRLSQIRHRSFRCSRCSSKRARTESE